MTRLPLLFLLAALGGLGCAGLGRLFGADGEPYLYEETDLEADDLELAEFPQSNAQPYVLLGKLLFAGDEPVSGGLFVREGHIIEVWEGDTPPATVPAGTVTIQTGGIVLPGLIDLHNHASYNFLPLWQTTPSWANRYQWADATAYKRAVRDPYNAAKDAGDLDEMNKFSEVRALVGGTTSIVGETASTGAGILVRNLDQGTLGGDKMRMWVGHPEEWECQRQAGCPAQPAALTRLRDDFAARRLFAILFHVAEGRPDDPASVAEFDWFKDHDLLRRQVVFVHGTALGPAQFAKMAENEMGLVWSPHSNLLLYGVTTDVRAAKDAGVKIALAPDWSPSGSDNLLAELRFAAAYNADKLACAFTARELVEMATTVPAELAGRKEQLGSLEPGHVADLLVLADPGGDPFEAVIFSDESDVRLVTVNGVPLHGRKDWLDRLGKAGDQEPLTLRGAARALDANVPADPRVPKGTQRLSDIRAVLEAVYAGFGTLPALTANGPGPATPPAGGYCGG